MGTEAANRLNVDGTLFTFPALWVVGIFDEWPQYTKAAGTLGMEGCDIVAFDGEVLWLIEMKDYTYPGARQPGDLAKTVGRKAMGTMALLFSLERSAAESEAQRFAQACRSASKVHLALHIDVKDGGRKSRQIQSLLMPLQDKLRKAQKALGISKSFVTSTLSPDPHTPWHAMRDPATRDRHTDR